MAGDKNIFKSLSDRSTEDKLALELRELLGEFIIRFNSLESSLLFSIHYLGVRNYPLTLCLLGGADFTNLLEKLTNIVHYTVREKDILSEYSDVKETLVSINKARNEFIHTHDWTLRDNKIIRVKPKRQIGRSDGKYYTHEANFDINRLRKLPKEVSNAREKLIAFIDKHQEIFFEKLAKNYDDPDPQKTK
jgi:hypothetical protein